MDDGPAQPGSRVVIVEVLPANTSFITGGVTADSGIGHYGRTSRQPFLEVAAEGKSIRKAWMGSPVGHGAHRTSRDAEAEHSAQTIFPSARGVTPARSARDTTRRSGAICADAYCKSMLTRCAIHCRSSTFAFSTSPPQKSHAAPELPESGLL
jgi:hypothetical protein